MRHSPPAADLVRRPARHERPERTAPVGPFWWRIVPDRPATEAEMKSRRGPTSSAARVRHARPDLDPGGKPKGVLRLVVVQPPARQHCAVEELFLILTDWAFRAGEWLSLPGGLQLPPTIRANVAAQMPLVPNEVAPIAGCTASNAMSGARGSAMVSSVQGRSSMRFSPAPDTGQ